jgi:hypothetical protein
MAGLGLVSGLLSATVGFDLELPALAPVGWVFLLAPGALPIGFFFGAAIAPGAVDPHAQRMGAAGAAGDDHVRLGRGHPGRDPVAAQCGIALFLAAAVWGVAFLFQKAAMDHVEPLAFIAARSV